MPSLRFDISVVLCATRVCDVASRLDCVKRTVGEHTVITFLRELSFSFIFTSVMLHHHLKSPRLVLRLLSTVFYIIFPLTVVLQWMKWYSNKKRKNRKQNCSFFFWRIGLLCCDSWSSWKRFQPTNEYYLLDLRRESQSRVCHRKKFTNLVIPMTYGLHRNKEGTNPRWVLHLWDVCPTVPMEGDELRL